MSLDLVEQLELDLNQSYALCRGVGGDAQGSFVHLNDISVGDASMKDTNVMAVNFDEISPRGNSIKNGIIGAPFLRNFSLVIDYPRRRFSFTS